MSDEKIVRRSTDGTLMIFCPGCRCGHGVNSGWTFNGDMERPTFSPSILVRSFKLSDEGVAMIRRGDPPPEGTDRYPGQDTVCHSYVKDGCIQFLSDCTHALAGQTVPLEAF